MRVLLDECVDWRLGRELASHEVKTARQMGWTALKNGELLALASAAFDVFVTVDRNLSLQQDIVSFQIAVVVLQARTNRLADLRPLVPSLISAIDATPPGMAKFIGPERRSHIDCLAPIAAASMTRIMAAALTTSGGQAARALRPAPRPRSWPRAAGNPANAGQDRPRIPMDASRHP